MNHIISNSILDARAIAERIDLIRRKRGMTQGELARVLNISQPAISKYLRERIPSADVLLKLARLGETTVEWILTGEKSYFYRSPAQTAHEPGNLVYDAERKLAQSIALLPAPVREAITTLIGYYQPGTDA